MVELLNSSEQALLHDVRDEVSRDKETIRQFQGELDEIKQTITNEIENTSSQVSQDLSGNTDLSDILVRIDGIEDRLGAYLDIREGRMMQSFEEMQERINALQNRTLGSMIGQSVRDTASHTLSALSNSVSAARNTISNTFDGFRETVGDAFYGIKENVKDFAAEIGERIQEKVGQAREAAGHYLSIIQDVDLRTTGMKLREKSDIERNKSYSLDERRAARDDRKIDLANEYIEKINERSRNSNERGFFGRAWDRVMDKQDTRHLKQVERSMLKDHLLDNVRDGFIGITRSVASKLESIKNATSQKLYNGVYNTLDGLTNAIEQRAENKGVSLERTERSAYQQRMLNKYGNISTDRTRNVGRDF